MAITSKLGTSDSRLNNMLLGALTEAIGTDIFDESIILSSSALISLNTNYPVFNIDAISSIDFIYSSSLEANISLTTTSSITFLGGVLLELTINPIAITAIDFIPGFAYSDNVNISSSSSITFLDAIIIGNVSNIDATASFSISEVVEPGNFFSISGSSLISFSSNADLQDSFTLTCRASWYPENIFDFVQADLYSSSAIGFIHTYSTDPVLNIQSLATLSFTVDGSISVSLSNTLTFTQSLLYKRPVVNLNQNFALTHSFTTKKIITPTLTNTLTFIQSLLRIRPIVQNLTLTQSMIGVKSIIKKLSNIFAINQSLNSNNTFNINIIQNILFYHDYIKILPLNYTPIIIPGLIGTKTKEKCIFKIVVPARAIVLPCPLFGDSENYTGEISPKKTINGQTYVYIKKTTTDTLQYTFTIDTQKRFELLKFVEDFNTELMTVYNHKSEIWKVFLTNNPISADSKGRYDLCGEKFDVVLEFEGIKVS